MKTAPIVAARVERDERGVPFSPLFGDVYHPAAGALQQAEHVFLRGNGLPGRFAGRDSFVVLETGFGLGNNFLATWDAWRRAGRPCRLHFISIEQHPLTRDDMAAMPRDESVAGLARQLVEAWPPLTPNLHRLGFEDGQVELLLALGNAQDWLPELVAQVDAFFLDGFTPAKNPQMWEPRLFKAMGRMAAPGATAATWSVARAVRDGLAAAGFEVTRQPGVGGKFDITVARYSPRFAPKASPSRHAGSAPSRGRAVVIGAGLAGCATAWALAGQGWTCEVLDANDQPAMATSGNPAGLFHGVVNAQDGTHARFNRAAALEARRVISGLLTQQPGLGEVRGLLRLETSGLDAAAMQSSLAALGLPEDYVQAVAADQAAAIAGMAMAHPAWFYGGGGWVRPALLARSLLAASGAQVMFRGGLQVDSLRRHEGRWQVIDARAQVIAEGDAVVLANAGSSMKLAGTAWPMQPVRGQLSMAPAGTMALPRVPVAGSGYLLPPVDGLAMFGATVHTDDLEPDCRDADHAHNLRQVQQLTADAGWARLDPASLSGRVGWRWVTDDRLPVLGGVPLPADQLHGKRLDQPRFVPRQEGLYVFTGLASRGITWCMLGARGLASMITRAPVPLEASLIDAVDVARFVSREARRQ
ncbi:bifunctional tRNA (5-methylaminomethyl-2-thiouridine)(34)-methyltransferase MnmD/FAD-dependent 5-carboxymethylaminomethyl-2-thiouridine(34) oxidoreductase MnmC [Piscinibacter terrae]|uniref:tRNA 5-methylaminomethyl-2-thiouridine biosynthesis bifunctional protein MnmC n=1 Tax=Piscinibacter terrae TaxID=2496871 RepID=A0A3N7HLX1_9BURK|nr:bifunctional tRNA (5-methylaminomethyl-2-thiouridine)(34)-methyltransferase MnmD/FAD-dependent 5-carboxymethylaminomethyl-2-thiouridine(34) oxidoreductase MnmC [Albitalea terrae]RQP22026.1 bifunctional tRNA (5-methylaminomethyl-2-thiouridine)(34)-methyltransferase MnmD/FAD-dependent 5-carboxymethylaminomethyl-2-thiouridine(34) oxidoreductase MnmC [Albitalea terrae]